MNTNRWRCHSRNVHICRGRTIWDWRRIVGQWRERVGRWQQNLYVRFREEFPDEHPEWLFEVAGMAALENDRIEMAQTTRGDIAALPTCEEAA